MDLKQIKVTSGYRWTRLEWPPFAFEIRATSENSFHLSYRHVKNESRDFGSLPIRW